MTTKLTLSIDDRVIHSAKKYAQGRGKSLSGIVENYLKSITAKGSSEGIIYPQVLKLKGSLKLPRNFDDKRELGRALAKKYGR